jgi:hypothetical protein
VRSATCAALIAAALAPCGAGAVSLDPGGLGQALIYPYYTARAAAGNNWNTYLTVTNHRPEAKVVRVRFREGRNGREVGSFNLYLAPNDVWTAAVIPTDYAEAAPAMFIGSDRSCINPLRSSLGLPGGDFAFSNTAYAGSRADGLGDGLDRTREGYVEVIEMATLSGASAGAVTPGFSVAANCAAVQGANVVLQGIGPPTGGLSGTLTLINVNSGMDFGQNAEALSALTTQPFYRNYDDPYPGFDAAEVTPVSTFVANGKHYRLAWVNGLQAVESALMRLTVVNEFTREAQTRSQTDWVLTFPTRHFRVTDTGAAAPFTQACESMAAFTYDRAAAVYSGGGCVSGACNVISVCNAASVLPVQPAETSVPVPGSFVFGSRNVSGLGIPAPPLGFSAGWVRASFVSPVAAGTGARSLASSLSLDLQTGQVVTGSFTQYGLPVVGLMARSLQNGTLSCGTVSGTASCQGNYGGSLPHTYMRSIAP